LKLLKGQPSKPFTPSNDKQVIVNTRREDELVEN